MSVHALKSNFGKITRGVALALAMTGGAGAALAQETPAPQPDAATPQATEQQQAAAQPGLPATCLPANDLNKDIGPTSGYLKDFAEGLQGYSGFPALKSALEDAGVTIDGYCAAVYPPQQMTGGFVKLDQEDTYTSLDLNITAMARNGNQIAISAAPPEMVAPMIKGIFLPEAVKALALQTSHYVTKPTDDMDTTVLLSTVIQANAIAEEALYAIDSYARTNNDEALQHILGSQQLDLYKDAVTELWTNAIDRDLTDADKNAFRVAVATLALKDPAMRQQGYETTSKIILALVTHGQVDPTVAFKTALDAEDLAGRMKQLSPAYADLDVLGIAAALKANPDDPSIKANAYVAEVLKKFNDFMNSMGGKQQDQQPTPATPAPNL